MGNYEFIGFGQQAEALKILTGAPTKKIVVADINGPT